MVKRVKSVLSQDKVYILSLIDLVCHPKNNMAQIVKPDESHRPLPPVPGHCGGPLRITVSNHFTRTAMIKKDGPQQVLERM